MAKIDADKVNELNDKVYGNGGIDREHLLEFLTLIPTNDATTIIAEVKNWLTKLEADPKYDKVKFPKGDIDAIIGDLDSYGRVQADTILQFKQSSSRSIPQS